MTDYYHFFGLQNKENRFLMRLVNPYAFDIITAQIALSGLFVTHGSCPASNDVTWSPWKAGKTIYQLWNVTPNKLGLIRSATPTLTLDGVPYLGLQIYLLSLSDYVKYYSEVAKLAPGGSYRPQFIDLDATIITGEVGDFIPWSLGIFDSVNMSGIYFNNYCRPVSWETIKSWVEAGNVWIETYRINITPMTVLDNRTITAGDPIKCIQTDVELSPIGNKSVAARATSIYMGHVSAISPPSGWTGRNLVQWTHAGVTYNMIAEMTHTASGGKVIFVGGYYEPGLGDLSMLEGWWWPIFLFQYPMMKLAGVSAYYTE